MIEAESDCTKTNPHPFGEGATTRRAAPSACLTLQKNIKDPAINLFFALLVEHSKPLYRLSN